MSEPAEIETGDVQETEERTGVEIAVIGMSGRFPGARNTVQFWENLIDGVESLSFLTGDDEELKESGIEPDALDNPNYVRSAGGLLEDKAYFDASFFEYTPAEAVMMDPQVRVFHECAWNALEDAAYDPGKYHELIGLYAGASNHLYWQLLSLVKGNAGEVGEMAATLLNDKDFLCTQVSYKLNLKGPALAVQTACSTSLVAIHLACQAILNGECEIALAGGVTAYAQPDQGYVYREGMIISPDGHCRAFDAKGKGIANGSGVGVVVLKRLEDAETDGDYIHAIVKGTAINNDGSGKSGYTAPGREGQSEVIMIAQQVAEVEPESISYIEAHGTATPLGDPIEIEALKRAFNSDKEGFCAIGSVKTNVGHLGSAAGVCGFIKTVLALKHRMIPPSLHFETPNPNIDFDNSPFYVNTKPLQWKNENGPLRAGVSSFGIGGTNAHVVVEAAPPVKPKQNDDFENVCRILPLSAKTPSALDRVTTDLAAYLEQHPRASLGNVAYTLQVGRKELEYRKVLVCSSVEEAVEHLSSPDSRKIHTMHLHPKQDTPFVVFLFPGLGSQYLDMGADLYSRQPRFKEVMDHCFKILEPLMDINIKAALYPGEGAGKGKVPTEILQPVLFSFEYALAALIMDWGIRPDAMMGYSFGEYTA
ncbi:MAG: type I polyketide synthase, partial [bacterium]|nr:type I polyketide synthase [bacterium]